MRDMTQHLAVSQYGDFQLTSAIRPSLDLQVIPREGYRCEVYTDPGSGASIPMLAASVSREHIFDVLMALLDQCGDVVDLVIESHHQTSGKRKSRDYLREHIDLPVLKSYFYEFEEILVDDGCLGIAVVDPTGPSEIQFDDHKVFIVYSRKLEPFIEVLESFGIPRDDELKLISEGEHLHSTCPAFADRVQEFCYHTGTQ